MKTPIPNQPVNRLTFSNLLPWLAVLALALGLAAFAWAGTYARLWADDYCYSSTVQQYGLIRAIGEWYNLSGSRFAAIPLVALTDLFGVWGVRLFPAWVLLLWALAGAALLRALAERLGWKLRTAWLFFFGLLLAFFAAYLAPDRLQTVYWRMGVIHYSLPVPLFLTLLTILLVEPRQMGGWVRAKRLAGFGLAAFFIGGFSETFAALMVGVLALLLLALPLDWRRNRECFISTGAALLGTLAAMAVMALSPSNAWRQAALPPPDSLGQLISYTLRYSLDFMRSSLLDQPLPNAVYAGLCALGAFLAAPGGLKIRPALAGMLAAALAAFGVILCATAPSVYGGLAAPAGRALMPSRFAWLAGLGLMAALAGLLLRGWLGQLRLARIAAGLILLGLCLYPLRGAVMVLGAESQALAVKAQRWDKRDANIRAEREAGVMQVQTHQVDVVQGLEDLGPDAQHWLNRCAAGYYGVQSITAQP